MFPNGFSVPHAVLVEAQMRFTVLIKGFYRPALQIQSDDPLCTPIHAIGHQHGQTIDFLLTEHRDKEAALRFLKEAIRRHGVPETITIDGSDANEAAIKSYNEEHGTHITIR